MFCTAIDWASPEALFQNLIFEGDSFGIIAAAGLMDASLSQSHLTFELNWADVSDRRMTSDGVVQRGLRTPTGPFFARFFIGIILGLVAEFAFMGQSTKLVMSSSAARWKGRKRIGGLKCRPGCSTARHTVTPGFWQLNRMSASKHLRRSLRCSIWR